LATELVSKSASSCAIGAEEILDSWETLQETNAKERAPKQARRANRQAKRKETFMVHTPEKNKLKKKRITIAIFVSFDLYQTIYRNDTHFFAKSQENLCLNNKMFQRAKTKSEQNPMFCPLLSLSFCGFTEICARVVSSSNYK
jgi:hypothetical protein